MSKKPPKQPRTAIDTFERANKNKTYSHKQKGDIYKLETIYFNASARGWYVKAHNLTTQEYEDMTLEDFHNLDELVEK